MPDGMRDRLLVPAAGLCLLVGTAAYLMVFTMLGQIAAALNVSAALLGWMVIATIITGTVSAALFPALGSVIGQRRLMAVAMGCLAVGSIVSAAAPDAATLLIGRIIAAPGFAAGTLSIAIVGQHRCGPGLSRSFGVLAAFAGASGVGFTLGGAVEEAARGDWRAVFLAVAAVSAVTGVVAAATFPAGPPASRRSDVPGAVLLAAGLVAALLPITEGGAWGWTSWPVIGLFAGAIVLLTAWAAIELRRADPLVRLGVLALPGVIAGTVLFVVTEATVSVINITVPPFLEAQPATAGYGDAASVLDAGLALLPATLAITLAGLAAGRLARRVAPRAIASVTLGCETVALGLLAGLHPSAVDVVILLAVFGAGHGGTIAVEYALLTQRVPSGAAGESVGLAGGAAGISAAVATAVTTALLAARRVRAGAGTHPAASRYDHAWLCAAAVAAVGAVAVAAGAYGARGRTRQPAIPDATAIPGRR